MLKFIVAKFGFWMISNNVREFLICANIPRKYLSHLYREAFKTVIGNNVSEWERARLYQHMFGQNPWWANIKVVWWSSYCEQKLSLAHLPNLQTKVCGASCWIMGKTSMGMCIVYRNRLLDRCILKGLWKVWGKWWFRNLSKKTMIRFWKR